MKVLSISSILVVAALAAGCSSMAGGSAEGGYVRVLGDATNVRQYSPAEPPYDFYILGDMSGSGFKPVGNIQGHGKLCADGKNWLDLHNGTYHTSDSPVAPYVTGCGTGASFQPSTRTVTY